MNEHSHYFKDVSHLDRIDVYRVVELFEVPAGPLDHAAKKILCAGGRGHKDLERDVQDAIDSLHRWQEMRAEDRRRPEAPAKDPRAVVGADLRFDQTGRQEVVEQNGNDGEHYRVPTATVWK